MEGETDDRRDDLLRSDEKLDIIGRELTKARRSSGGRQHAAGHPCHREHALDGQRPFADEEVISPPEVALAQRAEGFESRVGGIDDPCVGHGEGG